MHAEDIYSKTETIESRTVVVKIMDTSESVSCRIATLTLLNLQLQRLAQLSCERLQRPLHRLNNQYYV